MLTPDYKELIKLANYKMPFGKYKSKYLIDIPEYYFVWFRQKGFPTGELGRMMTQMHDIKVNGLEQIIHQIREQFPNE
jgi:uncharacterized protein (DUF3820 family)